MSGPMFHALGCWKTMLTHVGVGMGAASFWRGAWYVLDDQLFPENPEASAMTCLGLGTAGMAASQGLVARALSVQRPILKPMARFGALYTIAMSCVFVWRGTWVGWDCVYERLLNSPTTVLVHPHNQKKEANDAINTNNDDKNKEITLTSRATTSISNAIASTSTALMATSSSYIEHSPAHATIKSTDPGHLTTSGLASHVFAILALGSCGVFASVLAPPAAVSVIKDLAIKVSRPSVSSSGTTTSFLKRTTTNEAIEYVPHLAGHWRNRTASSSSQSPNMSTARTMSRNFMTLASTSVRGFHNSAFQATRYRY